MQYKEGVLPMIYSELVILAKEIHEKILEKIEKKKGFNFILYSEQTEICMKFIPEYITVSTDIYEISDGVDSSIHIKNKEVTHIYKEGDDIDGILYSISFKNETQMIIIL